MSTSETAQFIRDRALSLHYEGTHFRATADVALAWVSPSLRLGETGHGHGQLVAHLSVQTREIREALQ